MNGLQIWAENLRYLGRALRRVPWHAQYKVRRALGFGHECDFCDPVTGEYIGACVRKGLHRGR